MSRSESQPEKLNETTYPQQPIGRHRNTGGVEGYHPAVKFEPMTHPVLTPAQIRAVYQRNNPDGHCFDRKSMAFFGDTMRNFRAVRTETGYRLERRRPVKHGLTSVLQFDTKCAYLGTVTP